MMMSEIPFPRPLSVIFSPSHITNIVPDIRITTVENQKKGVGDEILGSKGDIAWGGSCEIRLAI